MSTCTLELWKHRLLAERHDVLVHVLAACTFFFLETLVNRRLMHLKALDGHAHIPTAPSHVLFARSQPAHAPIPNSHHGVSSPPPPFDKRLLKS